MKPVVTGPAVPLTQMRGEAAPSAPLPTPLAPPAPLPIPPASLVASTDGEVDSTPDVGLPSPEVESDPEVEEIIEEESPSPDEDEGQAEQGSGFVGSFSSPRTHQTVSVMARRGEAPSAAMSRVRSAHENGDPSGSFFSPGYEPYVPFSKVKPLDETTSFIFTGPQLF
jgi:hypothetical protein